MGTKKHWLTYDSTAGELYRNPVGHDALARVLLQLGLPEHVITNRDCNPGAKPCRAFPVKGKGELVYDTVSTGKRAVKVPEGYEARIWRADMHCTAKGGL